MSAIEDTKNEVDLKVSAKVTWKESRALYRNLKINSEANILKAEEKAKLWIPKLVFQNSQVKYNTVDNLSGTKLLILRQGKATQAGFEVAEDTDYYSGQENTVVMTLTATLKIKCVKNFNAFPFDKQVKYFPTII